MLRTNAQSVLVDDLGDLRHWSGRFKTEIADNDKCFVDEDARPLFQLRKRYPRIDIAVVISPADYDVGCVFGDRAKTCSDAMSRRSDLLDHFFEFLDHLPRLTDHLRLI